jgi:hypothetical protein
MRTNGWRSTALLAGIVGASFAAYTHAQGQADAKAASVVRDMRRALGGEEKIAGIRSLSLRADYRRELGAPPGGGGGTTVVMMGGPGAATHPAGGQSTGTIEIDVELPDRYLRSDIGSGGFSMTRTEGFEGARPFVEVVPNSPGMRVQIDNPLADPARAKMALKRSNTELARLFLCLTGGALPGFPLSYAYGGVAESPDGKADIIDVSGPEGFKARLFVDTESHLPLMLTYIEPEVRMVMRTMTRDDASGRRGDSPPRTASSASGSVQSALTPEQRAEIEAQRKEAEATPPKMIEHKLFFSEHRKVDDVLLPHRIARGTADKTSEEWEITSYKVNASIKADRFKIGSH